MKDIDTNSFSYMNIKPDSEFSNVILAIHGYNDYSNSFKIPGEYLSKNNIALTSLISMALVKIRIKVNGLI